MFRHEFCIEHRVLGAGCAVHLVDGMQNSFRILIILVVGGGGDTEEFRAFDKAVDADGEILLIKSNKTGVIYRQEVGAEVIVIDLIICEEILVDSGHLSLYGFRNRNSIAGSVLHKAVDIDGNDLLGSGGHTACAKSIGEGVILNFVPEAAVMSNEAGRESEIGFVFIRSFETINIRIVSINRFNRSYLKTHVIVEHTVNAFHGRSVAGSIIADAIKREIPGICISANYNGFISPVGDVNNAVEAQRSAEPLNIFSKSFRSSIDAVAVATVGRIESVEDSLTEFYRLKKYVRIQTLFIAGMTGYIFIDKFCKGAAIQRNRICIVIWFPESKMLFDAAVSQTFFHLEYKALILLLIKRIIDGIIFVVFDIHTAITEIHTYKDSLLIGELPVLFGNSIKLSGVENQIIIFGEGFSGFKTIYSREEMIMSCLNVLIVRGNDAKHFLFLDTNRLCGYPSSIMIDLEVLLLRRRKIIEFLKGHQQNMIASLCKYFCIGGKAAACETIYTIRTVEEEGMTLGPHFRSEICPFFIDEFRAVVEEVHGFHRKGEGTAGTFLIEPCHEVLLQIGEGFPYRLGAVREDKFPEHAVEVRLIEIRHIMEHGLIIPGGGGDIEGVDYLFKAVLNDLLYRAVAAGHIHNVVDVGIIVFAVVLTDKVIKVEEKFRGGTGACELGAYCENEINETSAEGIQILGGYRGSADSGKTLEKEGVHSDGAAVRIKGAFIMDVDIMAFHISEEKFRNVISVHRSKLVTDAQAVGADDIELRDLARHSSDVLGFHIGVGVIFAAGRSVLCQLIGIDIIEVTTVLFVFLS